MSSWSSVVIEGAKGVDAQNPGDYDPNVSNTRYGVYHQVWDGQEEVNRNSYGTNRFGVI